MSTFIAARQLSGEHINSTVRIVESLGAKVEAIITGPLKTFSHSSDAVTISLGDRYNGSDVQIYQLKRADTIELNPHHMRVEDISELRKARP